MSVEAAWLPEPVPAMKLTFEITSPVCPFEIFATVDDRPLWYRQRGQRWELYEATATAIDPGLNEAGSAAGVDDQDHLYGPGVRWLATGRTNPHEEEGSLWAGLARLLARGAPDEVFQLVEDELRCEGWLDDPVDPGSAREQPPQLLDHPFNVIQHPPSPFWRSHHQQLPDHAAADRTVAGGGEDSSG